MRDHELNVGHLFDEHGAINWHVLANFHFDFDPPVTPYHHIRHYTEP